MTISIIIAVKTWQENLEDCVGRCLQLDYPDFEIIILPDSNIGTVPDKAITINSKGTVPIIVIPTGTVSPANKRDVALKYAKGEILAFIDDDVYPQKDWLKNAAKNFLEPEVAAVGGPAVTPTEDNMRQKASGLVYASFLVSAKFVYRYLPKDRQEVDDYPSCNFLVRKSIMQELGGFKTSFWPGEDTKLCLDITKRLNQKIIYDPEVLVYHHRRPLFLPHLKQIANYALHRGYFVKRYPQTSLRISYFIPSLFLFVLVMGEFFSLFSIPLRITYFLGLSLYLSLVFIFSIIGAVPDLSRAKPQERELPLRILLIPLVSSGIVLTHLTYGFYFIKGLLSKRLKEE